MKTAFVRAPQEFGDASADDSSGIGSKRKCLDVATDLAEVGGAPFHTVSPGVLEIPKPPQQPSVPYVGSLSTMSTPMQASTGSNLANQHLGDTYVRNTSFLNASNASENDRKAFDVIKRKSADVFDNRVPMNHATMPPSGISADFLKRGNPPAFNAASHPPNKFKAWNAHLLNYAKKMKYSNGMDSDSAHSYGSSSSGPASSSGDESDGELESSSRSGSMNASVESAYELSDAVAATNKLPLYGFTDTQSRISQFADAASNTLRPKRERKENVRYGEDFEVNSVPEGGARSTSQGRQYLGSPYSNKESAYAWDRKEVVSGESRGNADSSDYPFYEGNSRRTGGYVRKTHVHNRSVGGRDVFHVGRVGRISGRSTSLRERKNVNYAELQDGYETDEEDKIVDEQRQQYQVEQKYVHGVDRILTHQMDPETNVISYLIKWRGQAHLHNTWEVYETLQHVHGIKKVDNYIRKIQETEKRRSLMTLDEIEQEDIAVELQRQLDEDALIAERIVEVSPDPQTGVQTFLVKWQSCPYDQCTWEVHETIVAHGFSHLIHAFYEREDRTHGTSAMNSVWNTQSLGRTKFEPYLQTPNYMCQDPSRKLRDYQLTGLNWMVSRMKYGLSVLLADEMGLGKTVQTISLVGHMLYTEHFMGPYLVIVPQSTIDNWMREFQYWMPQTNVVCFHGNAVGRDILRYYELRQVNVQDKGKRWRFDVCITTPSILNCAADVDFLRKICWQLMVVDEAHQLKNRNSKRFQELRQFQAEYKLLLSGTPLHNNLEELWSLLHFMNPLKYSFYEDFRRRYPDIENTSAIGETKQKQLGSLQAELHELILRRVKKDVEKSLPNKVESILQVEMSPVQETWYENVYTRNYEQLARSSGGARSSLQNICMELKKVCNHPFLCSLPQSGTRYQSGLVHESGKMCLLEKLLFRLKEKGHRVLIFSQMVRMLNIISDYLTQKGFKHQRLDGSMGKELRKKAMDHFNDPDSDDFAFLLSTKAGGLGINLTSADTVIIYDSDWNPQNDLQAEARAHRIGQTKTVQIYRLVTKNSIEQAILEKAKSKMVLDTLVVQGLNKRASSASGGNELFMDGSQSSSFTREELSKILKFGASNLWNRHKVNNGSSDQGVDVDLDKVLLEAQVSVSDTTGVADDLLSSFNNITEFRYEPALDEGTTNDKEFWASTIPLEERLKFKMAKEQELVVSGPRKTRAKDGFAVKGDEEEYGESDTEAVDATRRRKNLKNRKKASSISDKDRYRLYRSLLKFGTPTSRLEDIHEDSKLVKFDRKVILEECQDIIRLCRKRLQEIGYKHSVDVEEDASLQLNGDMKKEEGDSMSHTGTTSRHFVAIGDNKANAVDLVERVELLTMLDAYVKAQNPTIPEPWKLPAGPLNASKNTSPTAAAAQPPRILKLTLPEKVLQGLKGWTAKDVKSWGPTEDVNLIKGTYMYGFGCWTEVHADPNLSLGQVKDIKFDKVKMRALRTLKLLEAASHEGKQKQKRRHLKGLGKEMTANQLNEGYPNLEDTSNATDSLGLQSTEFKASVKEKRKRAFKGDMGNAEMEVLKKRQKSRSPLAILQAMNMTTEDLTCLARKVLKSVKKPLKDMRNMTNDEGCSDHQVIGLMKHSLPLVGNKIGEALQHYPDSNFKSLLEEACWKYVSKYTIASAEDLKRVYLQLQSLSDSELSTNVPQTGWEETVPTLNEEAEVDPESYEASGSAPAESNASNYYDSNVCATHGNVGTFSAASVGTTVSANCLSIENRNDTESTVKISPSIISSTVDTPITVKLACTRSVANAAGNLSDQTAHH